MFIFFSYFSPAFYCPFPCSSLGRFRKGDVCCDSFNCFPPTWGTASCNTGENSPDRGTDRML